MEATEWKNGLPKLNDVQREDALRRFAAGEPAAKIAKDYDVTPSAIIASAKFHGVKAVPKNQKKLHILPEAVARYEAGETIAALAKHYGINRGVMGRMLATKTKTRFPERLTHREDAFDTLTEESAYWIGFLMADGCIGQRRSDGQQQVVSLGLNSSDEPHIVKFLEFLQCNATISRTQHAGKDGKTLHSSHCAITSQRLVDALALYGLGVNKTYTAEATDLVTANRHFWRGCVDGDGSLSATRKLKGEYVAEPTITLVGTEALMVQFKAFVESVVPDCSPSVCAAGSPVIRRVAIGCANAKALVRVLYADCTVSLERKQLIADEILAQPETSVRKQNRCKHIFAPEGLAWCGCCKTYKQPECFHKSSTSRNGLKPRCKECKSLENIKASQELARER